MRAAEDWVAFCKDVNPYGLDVRNLNGKSRHGLGLTHYEVVAR
jgi:hypothetical protein